MVARIGVLLVEALAAARSGWMDCSVDACLLVVVAGRRDKHRRVGFSAHPVPNLRGPQEQSKRQLELKPASQLSQPATTYDLVA